MTPSATLEAAKIPVDVIEKANNIACVLASDYDGHVMAIARAILAERQAERDRCNAIVRAAWGQNVSIEAFETVMKAEAIAAAHAPAPKNDDPKAFDAWWEHSA